MKNCDMNKRHQAFKRELRAYHDTINRGNRYSLQKMVGKLNMFEAIEDDEEDSESSDETYEIDRKIPNTGLTVLKLENLYAIGDYDGNPITKFKYVFIEGCLGDHEKIVRCVTDDGKIEDFDVNTETIVEDGSGACGGMSAAPQQVSGIGTGDISSSNCGGKDYHEIDYNDVREQLTIPFLCGARVVDVNRRRRKNKKKRVGRRSR
jgi:hypothetical protein